MIFDLDFVNLELKAAASGVVPEALTDHPVFQAIAFHEAQLDRPELTRARFCAALRAAARNEDGSWGLRALFDRRENLLKLIGWLSEDSQGIFQMMAAWLSHFTTARLTGALRCILYVGTHDGGFKLASDSEDIFINAAALTNLDCFLETLAHECYHARTKSPALVRRIQRLEEENDYLGAVLYSTFEEGTADFVGNNGATVTQNPVFPLRPPEEGAAQLRQLLRDYRSGSLSGEALYMTFRKTDCCYTAGVYIAAAVWQDCGIDGLDVWSQELDWMKYYSLFRSTEPGADWPELV
ncbi:MAG: hypothetical protein Q4F17_04145 [Eubacteriales bacterium]|nr:hypothetical protein [Eubacteriales bacterium]